MRAIAGLWRWRHNPLRRTTDLVEAWVMVVALAVIVVAAPVVGTVVAHRSHDALHEAAREQQRTRHHISATVVNEVARRPISPDSANDSDHRTRVVADWVAPDGTQHSGLVLTSRVSPDPGDRIPLWTDASGRIVPRPMPPATASAHAVLAGVGAAAVTGLLVEGARRITVWRLIRRRYAAWDEAWARTGPDWGRTGKES